MARSASASSASSASSARSLSGAARLLAAALAAASAAALYESGDGVLQIASEKDWNDKVIKAPGLFLVEFYAPWCGHCKNLAPEWKKAAKTLKGVVTVVAVDATAVQALASKYKVEGFPTIKVFGENKGAPTDYQGARESPAIVQFAMKEVAALVQARAGGGGGKKGGKSGGGGGGGGSKPATETGGGKSVVTLTAANFDELVLNGPEAWLVEFYAPWCGHCKSLAPEWASAADKMKGDAAVRFGAVDATAHAELAQRFDVKGYPTIKQFAGGAGKKDKDATDYAGERKSEALVEAATRLAASGGAPAAPIKVEQLVSRAQWAETCAGKTLCVVAVLPHILDDKKAGREARLAALGEAAAKSRGKPFKFLWTEAGAQPALEAALAVGLVPALFAVSTDKRIFISHKGSFAAAALASFAAGLSTNKGAAGAQPLPAAFEPATALADVAAWDGKDAAQEGGGDSFSLDELDL